MLRGSLLSALLIAAAALTSQASVLQQRAPPTLKLGSATLTGSYGLLGAEAFRSIPYALPPTGQRRFRAPVNAPPLTGAYDATRNPQACRQFLSQATNATGTPDAISNAFTSFFNGPLYSNFIDTLGRIVGLTGQTALDTSEDCLYLNVVRPAGTKAGDKLPIVVFLYGGAYSFGDLSVYDPAALIKRSVDMKQPIIHVAMNYRVGAYGFAPFVDSNMGLLDQRMAFEWVQTYASQFGGDPEKVTLWGESAGAVSIGMHLISEGTTSTNLFRAVIAESGSPYRIPRREEVTKGTSIIARFTGCDLAPEGLLQCLQSKTTREIDAAAQQVPGLNSWSGVVLPFPPVVDGSFIPDAPDRLVKAGKFKRNVVILNGNQDDEGPLLTTGVIGNTTDDAGFERWIKEVLLSKISDAQYQQVARLYPNNPSAGSPYGTGQLNQVNPQSKRVASIFGDVTFTMPRKVFLREAVKYGSKVYSYNYRGFKYLPFLGSFHAAELVNTYGLAVGSRLTDDMQSRWIGFINNMTPDAPNLPLKWPSYGTERKILAFDELATKVEEDNQRDAQHAYLEQIINV